MSKKSILEKFTSKIASQKDKAQLKSRVEEDTANAETEAEAEAEGEVDHLWMTEDHDAEKPKLEKDPRIDSGILRSRIAEKLSKLDKE